MNFASWFDSQPGSQKQQINADFGGLTIKNPIIRAMMNQNSPFPVNKEQEAVQRPDKPFIAAETGNFGVDMGGQ